MASDNNGERAITIELAQCTATLLQEIGDKRFTQADVAKTYALAIMSSEATDWTAVNQAIRKRWSLAGLERVKLAAWKRVV